MSFWLLLARFHNQRDTMQWTTLCGNGEWIWTIVIQESKSCALPALATPFYRSAFNPPPDNSNGSVAFETCDSLESGLLIWCWHSESNREKVSGVWDHRVCLLRHASMWCPWQDLNLHAEALDPKSSVSAVPPHGLGDVFVRDACYLEVQSKCWFAVSVSLN